MAKESMKAREVKRAKLVAKHAKKRAELKKIIIQETAEKAAQSYKSTLAVTYLTEILELAKTINYTKPKAGNKKQSRFSDVIIMQYNKANFGKIKLTVGILRGSREKLQYCITAIEKTTVRPATNTQ
jgi:hypothetical protein